MALILRVPNPSPLTFQELDDNFTYLDDKIDYIFSNWVNTGVTANQTINGNLTLNGAFKVINLTNVNSPTHVVTYNTGTGLFTSTTVSNLFASLPALNGVITTGSIGQTQSITGSLIVNKLTVNQDFYLTPLTQLAKPHLLTYDLGTGKVYYFPTSSFSKVGLITTGSNGLNQTITGSLSITQALNVTGSARINGNVSITGSLYLRPIPYAIMPHVITYNPTTGEFTYADTSIIASNLSGVIFTGSALLKQSITGSLTISGSNALTVSGAFYYSASLGNFKNVMVIDTASGRLHYTSSAGFLNGYITTGSSTSIQAITGSLIVSNSFTVTGSTYLTLTSESQNYIVTYDTSSGKLYYTSSNALFDTSKYIHTGSNSSTQAITGSLIISNSLTITGSLYYSASVGNYNNVLVLDTGSGKLYYTSSEALGIGKTKAQSGSVSQFAGSPLSASITFTTQFPDNLYSVTVSGEDARVWTIQNKTSANFQINSNSSVSLGGPVYWIATQFNNP